MAHGSERTSSLGRALTLAILLTLFGGLLAPRDRLVQAQNDPAARSGSAGVGEGIKLIDEKLAEAWTENKVKPSDRCTDYEFIRRASLDIIGRIATPGEIKRFLDDPAPTRRSQLIERLLQSDEYPRHWGNLWANWLLSRSGAFGRGQYHDQMVSWLKDQFAQKDRRFDQIVTDLITATGKNTENGAVNFILAHLGEPTPAPDAAKLGQFDMVPITSRISRLFLGIQTQCTQCHDHPFDSKLKQDHFWGLNAFLRQVRREGNPPNPNMRAMSFPTLGLADNTRVNVDATVYYEKRNAVVLPARAKFLDGSRLTTEEKNGEKFPVQGLPRRQELARMTVEHPNFPRALINRMWAHFFGKGFTNPIDDFNDQNQPSHPELLDELGKLYRHYGFDQRMLIRWICNSQAYNLSSTANSTNEKPDAEQLFGRMLLKALPPEVLFESLMKATLPNAKPDALKDQRARWLDNLVNNFGDDEGNEVSFNGTVVQALMMMNGADLNAAVNNKEEGTVAVVARKRGATPQSVVYDLYLHALNRLPTPAEVRAINGELRVRRDRDPLAIYQDLLWALINSNEFMLNH
jgi:hypothetical protein